MLTSEDRSWQALAGAVEVAIAEGVLEPKARSWGKTVLLEAMADILGLPPTSLRNRYYRGDERLLALFNDYAMSTADGLIGLLRGLEFRRFSPLVWKRPLTQLAASREALPRTMTLLRLADEKLRARMSPPVELRREIGTVAAEVMACALTFYDGPERWELLSAADSIFCTAMGPLTLASEIGPADGALFARFWENRATRCGLEWSNIWDDPTVAPTIGLDVVQLAVDELDHATRWMKRHVAGANKTSEDDRLRQFAGDKAKWYAKAGRFDAARRELDHLSDFRTPAARADTLLVQALEQITGNALDDGARTAGALAEQLSDSADSIAPATSAILVHHIELLRGNRPKLGDNVVQFLRESPVAASEHINLPRYRRRLMALGYVEAA